MLIFETTLALLLGATILSAIARRVNIPYPTLLAVGGAVIAFLPDGPRLDLSPDLILALFVAPVLMDAAYDASLRDLRDNWRPITSLVLVAVSLTTLTAAYVARVFLPDLPWAAAIALGALLAPPDAVAALAVLSQVNPPHRVRMVLEGESLLNDASALLIYRLALGAVAAGQFDVGEALPTFALVVVGSTAAGWVLARASALIITQARDAPTSVIIQFVTTFAVWVLAERLGLSGVVTMVVFGLTIARRSEAVLAASLRIPTFAIWESVTVVLNVLAFTLIGLRLRPILETLVAGERLNYVIAAFAILGTVIAVRIAWVMSYVTAVQLKNRVFGVHVARPSLRPPTTRSGFIVAWSGMRGIVTLAAALALPQGFPHRDFMALTAFVVVLGTLVIQGVTLRPLLFLLRLPEDGILEQELRMARKLVLKAGMTVLENNESPAADRLRLEYGEALSLAFEGQDPRGRTDNALRQQLVTAARGALDDLRTAGKIGDHAYRRVEEELDWVELAANSQGAGVYSR